MQEKPRVGLVLMHSDWVACHQAQPSVQEIVSEVTRGIQADRQAVVDRLRRQFEVLGPWVVHSAESLEACQRALQDCDPDMVLVAYQTYAVDSYLTALIPAIGGRPLVLWCYLPWRRMPRPVSYPELLRTSGTVGAFAALGTLRNLKVPFLYTFGAPDDPLLEEDLRVAGRAARVRASLRAARFGQIPASDESMQSTHVDPARLTADLGPSVENIPVEELQRAAAAQSGEQVNNYLSALWNAFPVYNVSDECLERGARAALGLAGLAQDYRLNLLSLNDSSPELQRAFHLRPGLYPLLDAPPPGTPEVLYQPESDLGAATANYILHRLTGSPTMFMELWFWDEARNFVVGGHSGVQNPRLAAPGQTCVTPTLDICPRDLGPVAAGEDAQMQFTAREGRATLFQLRATPGGWQATAASGICLEGQPLVTGVPHAVLRLDTPLNHFLHRVATVGATPHWILAYGSVLHELEAFCQIERVPIEVLAA